MGDEIRKIAYFSMGVADKPGEAARILDILSQAGVNLLAFSGFPRGRRAQLDFVPEDLAAFRKAVTRAKVKVQPKKSGFLVQGEDRPGAIAEVLQKLAAANINVTAIDAVSAGAGRYGAILWVKPPDFSRAGKALKAVAAR
ncbi:MAG: ACT domain-containing protein [Deltaproteobacteria bacterium]|nr:ACT domain-containing protein [Deltaproteobacteria bacterium]